MPSYEEYIEAIKPLWDSHWITNMGVYHKELERQLKEYLGVPEVSLMVNGHMALELTIQAFGFPEGSEVITTPFTFISTTHAIVRNRLVPVFCDVKLSDGTIDETKIEELITKKTVAILPVHVYGNVCNVEAIKEIADRHGLKVIYDAAHAFGIKYKDIGIGNFGDASVFSFHATKVFNTIEGGAVTFADHDLYERLYNLKNFGIRGEEVVESIGANAKMNEFCAIMGLCNLKHVDEEILYRKRVHDDYYDFFKNMSGINLFNQLEEQTSNYSYFPIIICDSFNKERDEVFDFLRKEGIFSRKYFYPLTCRQDCFKLKCVDTNIEVSEFLSAKVLCIPIYNGLNQRDLQRIFDLFLMI